MDTTRSVSVTVNGEPRTMTVPARKLLCDALRQDLALTGSHVGCEHGACGACTVQVDGRLVRSCLMLAVQADGSEITTIEGLGSEGNLHPVQEAFWEEHGLQCGYCTPGMIMASADLLNRNPNPSEEQVRTALEGNLCRCTGYHNIVKAVLSAAQGGRSGTIDDGSLSGQQRENIERVAETGLGA
jgi:aerobic carbon-monoxide dehydrogenase small subunit